MKQGDTEMTFDNLAAFQAHFSKTNAHIDAVHMVNAGELDMVAEDEVKAIFTVVYHGGRWIRRISCTRPGQGITTRCGRRFGMIGF